MSYNFVENVSVSGFGQELSEALASGLPARVLCRLARDGFSGAVVVTSEQRNVTFTMAAGVVVFAEDHDQEGAFAEDLFRRGVIASRQFTDVMQAVAASHADNEDLAAYAALVEHGVLTADRVHVEMARRVRGVVIQGMALRGCEITLDADATPPPGRAHYPQELGAVLYMAVRTFFEEPEVEALLGALDAVHLRLSGRAEDASEFLGLDRGERELLAAFDPEVAVARSLEARGGDPLEAWQLVCMLELAGLAELSPSPFSPVSEHEASGLRATGHAAPDAEPSPVLGPAGRVLSARPIAVRQAQVTRSFPIADTGAEGAVVTFGGDEDEEQGSPAEQDAHATASAGRGSASEAHPHVQRSAPHARRIGEALRRGAAPPQSEGATGGGGAPAAHTPPARRDPPAAARPAAATRSAPVSPRPAPPAAAGPGQERSHVKQLLLRRRMQAQQAAGESARQHGSADFEEVQRLLKAQKFVRAERQMLELCKQHPDNETYELYRLWASFRAHNGLPETLAGRLRTLLRQRLNDDAEAAFAYFALGLMSLSAKKEDHAEKCFRKALGFDAKNKDAQRYLRIIEARRKAAAHAQSQKIFGIDISGKK